MQNNIFRILALGDVVGKAGLAALKAGLPQLKKRVGADITVVNGENASEPNGLNVEDARLIFASGADIITGGNHTLRHKDMLAFLDETRSVLRPANYPPLCPGRGCAVATCASGLRVLVVNVMGQVFMQQCDNPFVCAQTLLNEAAGSYDIAVCDIHAEATSEKQAFALAFDGRFAAVFGTHTHVPTADAQILPGGTGYITDLGMCGVRRGTVLGVEKEAIIKRFTTGVSDRFERAQAGEAVLDCALFEYDAARKVCVSATQMTEII